ncbi:MAG: GNAT family N-acetyltransferase [Candidatus Kerfeldbacteria bacterium]|nr:GNAT family N-acetyltransferase [Candidatus Kerfeldbacteria bacterium]
MPRKINKTRPPIKPFVYSLAQQSHVAALVKLGKKLWPHAAVSELRKEFDEYVHSKNDCLFIAQLARDRLVGFIHGSLRFEYVEGSQSSPVGYLEGLYVDPKYRRRGVARDLNRMFECWAKDKNCDTFASDTEATNALSQRVHQSLGYRIAQTVVHFIKDA